MNLTGDRVVSKDPAVKTAARRQSLPKLTDRLPLGRTGLTLSPYCLGLAGSSKVVPAAFDAGINCFFVSTDMHWPFYEQTRRGLKLLLARGSAVRDRIVVVATSYCTQPDFCWLPYRELVEAVPGLGRLDVMVAGGALLPEFRQRLEILKRQRSERYLGAVAIGASFHQRKQARAATCSRT